MGFTNPEGPDPSRPNRSQAYLTSIAARAVIYIEADNPNVGLMAFVAVGMGEVSTCEVTVKHGDRVKKGDQLGMFHFGGSTFCLTLRPLTRIGFHVKVLLNAPIAFVANA